MNIYTRTGDTGETGLYGGDRRRKSDLRVAAYGEVDELQAVIGVARASLDQDGSLQEILRGIQHDCFVLSSELARTATKTSRNDPVLQQDRIIELEAAIDTLDAALPPLQSFILLGGSIAGANLHLARAVCRRAERAIVALSAQEEVPETVLAYINRLSDCLFVLARTANQAAGVTEELWKP